MDAISFGNGKNIDFSGFNGVSDKAFKSESEKIKKLNEAVFKKYDKNKDGVLDRDDLLNLVNDIKSAAKGGKGEQLGKNEAQNYLTTTLGLSEGEYSRNDLYELLEVINADSDDIEDATTKNGITTIKYKPDQNGQTQIDSYQDNLLIKRVVSSQTGTNTINFENGAKKTEVIEKKDDTIPVTIEYEGDNGQEVEKCRYRKQGAVTEYLDDNNEVKTRITDKGSDVIERIEYNSMGDYTYLNDVLMKKVENIQGRQVSTNYIYVDGAVTEIKVDGQTRTKTVRTEDGELFSCFEIDETGNPKEYIHKVDKENDTWYGIVQAKYGVTDHKTTMEIVHKLKDDAKISYNSKTIPDTITLPPTIILKNNTTVVLKNINAIVDGKHYITANSNKNKIDQILKTYNIQNFDRYEQNEAGDYDVYDASNKKIGCLQHSNNWSYESYQYDNQGNINASFNYDEQGKLYSSYKYEFDSNNRVIKQEVYDDKSKLSSYTITTYNEEGQKDTETLYRNDKSIINRTVYEYNNSSVSRIRFYDGNGVEL